MTPTNKLRWLNKFETVEPYECSGGKRPVRVLQQWWEAPTHDTYYVDGNYGEWRDVEVVNES